MKKMIKLVVAMVIGCVLFTSCSKEENLPTPEVIVEEPTSDNMAPMTLEFISKLTTYNVGSDVMWDVNEGNCVVAGYYTSNGDTLTNGVNYNYPIYEILAPSSSRNILFGCNTPSDTLLYEYYPNTNEIKWRWEIWTIVTNNDSIFVFNQDYPNNTVTYRFRKI